jgi:hypothetical protein
MSKKFITIALGTMLGLSAVAFSGASASAAAMLPLSAVTSGDAQGASGGVIQIDHKNKKWKKKNWHKKNFNYCNGWNDRCHNNRRRDHFDDSYLFLPLIIGGGIAANNYYDNDYNDYDDDYDDGGGVSSRHIRYCLNKYQSYNPRYNTWVAYSGQVKKCYSPYM